MRTLVIDVILEALASFQSAERVALLEASSVSPKALRYVSKEKKDRP